jgi:cyclic 2,3-diphosphoglycerate synthase
VTRLLQQAAGEVRAVALIDGEHYAPVVRDALRALPYDWVGAILVGGTEKLRGEGDYGVPLVDSFGDAEVVVDLSDEPVLGPAARFRWISRALAAGLPYVGADFRFEPPTFEPFELPSIAVIGTGKRVGKTAVTGHLARLLSRDRDVVVVAMGRGGPAEPELIEEPPSVADLVERSRAGHHATSDHLETAVLCGVPTIGCRRAGGGLAGAVFTSNVSAGARLAVARGADVVIFDGSGAAIPPIAAARRVLVVGPGTDPDAYLNTYRRLVSDVVVALGCELEGAIPAQLRLRATGPLDGRVAVFTAGGTAVEHLEAEVVHVSANLADRDALRRELAALDADTYLVELKAAAIDVVAEHALEHGRQVVAAANDVVGDGLDEALLALADSPCAVESL